MVRRGSKNKLDIGELFRESGSKLSLFVGTLAHAGLQKEYNRSVELMKGGLKPPKIMTLKQYQKAEREFLDKLI